jgi:hypothetical protein
MKKFSDVASVIFLALIGVALIGAGLVVILAALYAGAWGFFASFMLSIAIGALPLLFGLFSIATAVSVARRTRRS